MLNARTSWIALAAFLVAQASVVAASAQQAGEPPAAARSAPDADAAPTPESGAADPLAPADVDKPAPAAPGAAAATGAAQAPAGESDPVILLVRERLAAMPPRHALGAKDDLAGTVAFYAERAQPLWTGKDGFTPRARLAMDEIAKADDWGLKASAIELPSLPEGAPSPEALADAEVKLSIAVLTYARHARGGRIEPAAASRKFDQKPVIFEPKSVLQGISAADAADAYLRGLHPKHPQFEKLRQALLAARQAAAVVAGDGKRPAVSVQQIVVNMERWRWMPPELGAFYVWDSIPEQMTYVYDNGMEVLAEKIVVGKLSSPTPIFSADMQFVIFHPSWGVPPGMKQHELLPQLRNTENGGWSFFSSKPLASSVLKAHGLTATRGGVPVDPDKIDWSKTDISQFHFTQPAGATNVLGRVKFRFPNKHDVYMHDTPERHLFGGAVRAFSHGCMRVQNPMHLAEVLLQHDKGWTVEQVREHERRASDIALSTPIPVHVTYFTVKVDDDGNVVTRPDLYGLDSRVASQLEGREVRVPSSAASVATGSIDRAATPPRSVRSVAVSEGSDEAAPAAPKPQRSAQKPRGKKDRKKAVAQEPKPFNPFGQLFGNN